MINSSVFGSYRATATHYHTSKASIILRLVSRSMNSETFVPILDVFSKVKSSRSSFGGQEWLPLVFLVRISTGGLGETLYRLLVLPLPKSKIPDQTLPLARDFPSIHMITPYSPHLVTALVQAHRKPSHYYIWSSRKWSHISLAYLSYSLQFLTPGFRTKVSQLTVVMMLLCRSTQTRQKLTCISTTRTTTLHHNLRLQWSINLQW